MPGEPLDYSGIRRIECLEDSGDAVWELDRASQTLRFTGLVKTTEGIGGLLVSSIIHHITLEMILPLERMIMALNLNGNGEGSQSARPRGPRPRRRTVCIRVRSPVRYNYVNGQGVGINNNGLGVNNNPNEQVVPEKTPPKIHMVGVVMMISQMVANNSLNSIFKILDYGV
ncbi:hypothetical protein QL285_058207 [Trifolium repens]|nr:hypothetical protein QL285_058207 [Trifolium repens]